jgi:hypothetical protein
MSREPSDWMRPGRIVRQFQAIWDMELSGLHQAIANLKQTLATQTDSIARMGTEAAIGTFQREIDRREKLAAKEPAQ